MLAFVRAEEAFAGEAEKAGFQTEEEMQDYMEEIRKEVRGYQLACNDSPILATAIMEGIDAFITGDKDFLVLDIDTPEIVTMADFLERYR